MLAKAVEAFFHFAGNSEADPASEFQITLASGEDVYNFFPLLLFDYGFLECVHYFKHYIEDFLKNHSMPPVYAWVNHRRDSLF